MCDIQANSNTNDKFGCTCKRVCDLHIVLIICKMLISPTIKVPVGIRRTFHINQVCSSWISVWRWPVGSRSNKLFQFPANVYCISYSHADLTGWLRGIPLRFRVSGCSSIVKSTLIALVFQFPTHFWLSP